MSEHKIPEGLKPEHWRPCGKAAPGGDHDPHWWNSNRWWCDGWPGPFPELHGADGCGRNCRRRLLAGEGHSMRWGECSYATPPPPTVSMSVVFRDTDGYNSIGFNTYTEEELAKLIEPALRDAGELPSYRDLARAAAHAIIHRNDKEQADGE